METQSMTLSEWQPTMPALDTTLTPVSLDNEWNKQMDSVLDPTGYPMLTAPPSTAFNYPLEGSNVTTNVNGTRTDALDMGAPITPPFTGTPAVQMSDLERADLYVPSIYWETGLTFAEMTSSLTERTSLRPS